MADPLDQARAAIVAQNYGEAAELAAAAVEETPDNPTAHYELARAEALRGNEGRALDAIGIAIDKGLGEAHRALEDPAFDSLRGKPAFALLVRRASPGISSTGRANVRAAIPEEPEPEVEIRSEGGREVIRAGDVVIDTDI